MGLEEGAELNQMVLDQDVLLSKLCLALLEVLLFLAEFLVLVFKGLLDLVHGTTLLQEAGGGGDAIELEVLRQFDFLRVH